MVLHWASRFHYWKPFHFFFPPFVFVRIIVSYNYLKKKRKKVSISIPIRILESQRNYTSKTWWFSLFSFFLFLRSKHIYYLKTGKKMRKKCSGWHRGANLGWKGITWKLIQRVTRVSVGFNYSKSHLRDHTVGGEMKLRYIYIYFFFLFVYMKTNKRPHL